MGRPSKESLAVYVLLLTLLAFASALPDALSISDRQQDPPTAETTYMMWNLRPVIRQQWQMTELSLSVTS